MRNHCALLPRPLVFSLGRYTSALAVVSALALATAPAVKAQTNTWLGNAEPAPGDGVLWTNPFNWTDNLLPAPTENVVFADPAAAIGTIFTNGNQTVNSLKFTVSETLGAYGTSD